METRTLLLAGIATAHRWPNIGGDVQILEIPPGRHSWYLPIATTCPAPGNEEEIRLEHFRHSNGEGLWLGYGARSNVLLFSHEEPLGNDLSPTLDKME